MLHHRKKKIRGWKRKTKQISQWFESNKGFSFSHFEKYREEYVKISVDPWNRLGKRTPPNWYFKLILQKLIEIHDLWNIEVSSLEVPFDLQIWLHDKVTMRSEIVCSAIENTMVNSEKYFRRSSDKKQFPARWQSGLYDLDRFNWQLHDDEIFWFKNLQELSESEISELLKDGFIGEVIEINNQVEVRYSKKVDHVWIGRLK